jgi:hypothetical protein
VEEEDREQVKLVTPGETYRTAGSAYLQRAEDAELQLCARGATVATSVR